MHEFLLKVADLPYLPGPSLGYFFGIEKKNQLLCKIFLEIVWILIYLCDI